MLGRLCPRGGCAKNDLSANDLDENLSFGSTEELKRKIILPFVELGYVVMTYPDKPTSAK